MEGLDVNGMRPRSNGSVEGDQFIGLWNRIVLDVRALEQRRRQLLAALDIHKVIPNDGWVKRVNGAPVRVPLDHPYGEYQTLRIGEQVGIGSVSDECEHEVRVYEVVRIEYGRILSHAAISWVRNVEWD